MRRRRPAPAPLPLRDGVDPVRVRLPAGEAEAPGTVRDHLLNRFPASAPELEELFACGGIVDDAGRPLAPGAPFRPGASVWYHRALPEEPELPGDLPVLFEDEWLLAVDKPHGLPTTPRGGFVAQSALVKLRRSRGEDRLSPLHRLDRGTAGVLLLSRDPATRGRFQSLFQSRAVGKEYEAVAEHRPGLDLPCLVESRIVKDRTSLQAREVPGPVNARTVLEAAGPPFTDAEGTWARYAVRPETGRTHQIRVHLAGLGVPVRHDPLYPEVRPAGAEDPDRPLQLLARRIALVHPVTGVPLVLESRRALMTGDAA
ncbi:ribosomal large subunit pseudouridine synthase D [Kocuria rosea subsp. polaris]|uniref:RNA pseudouridylate synthase n=1 Tax=Kocuria rosea subsp. polaris TaxID=136273 RepID=A0A0W8IJP8_KOCRO|nr:pseudouridine synthase [Kocuria polaris]KUG60072.1 ribosomal large subunit pseudouridine synthase D [Kocuria polaris]